MNIRISIDVDDLMRLTEEQQARLANLTPAWEAIGAETIRAIHRNVNEEGAYFGNPWVPLSSFTQNVKGRAGGRPLRDTGRMLASVQVTAIGPEGVTIGIMGSEKDRLKAEVHQQGAHIRNEGDIREHAILGEGVAMRGVAVRRGLRRGEVGGKMRRVAAWMGGVWGVHLTKEKMLEGISIPARPWFPATEEDVPPELIERAERILTTYVEEGFPGGA